MGDPARTGVARRSGRRRDRRGRGPRGPLVLPSPLHPGSARLKTTSGRRFDDVVLAAVDRLDKRWHAQLVDVEFGVEDTPPVSDAWDLEPVPLASLVRGDPKTRVVLFRKPIELRAATRAELAALVFDVVVEQVADAIGREPDEIDPR